MSTPHTTIVVPTMGRASLHVLLDSLARQTRPVDAPVILVDDRPDPGATPIEVTPYDLDVTVVRSGGGGPARARNIGWRHSRTPWVSFLDDDVLPDDDWYERLAEDLAAVEGHDVSGSEGLLTVPLPTDRRPTDWERGTAGLETSQWITADMSFRREELSRVGGFDERFPRAFREDADLAMRLGAEQGRVVTGRRHVTHPVRPADDLASLRQQKGNADDYLMRAVHGPGWQRRAAAPVGRRWTHVALTGAAAVAVAGLVTRRPAVAAVGALGWLGGTGEFAWRRIAPGPRDRAEVRRMLLTSAAIPFAATWHSALGALRHRGAGPWHGLPELVLLDRDGTLVEDVPYNGDPAEVRPMPGAREALDRLRREGIRLAVVSNQSGVARGLITPDQVDAVNARVAELLGPFEAVYTCPHGPDDGCECRKPAPGMIKQALADAGVAPDRALMIGDIGADLEAAEAAGVDAVLVPTPVTRPEEIAGAPRAAASLADVVEDVLRGAR
ncbi:HAD-IIIA family hydrolase [Nocardioides sp. Kera G14]|uniref:HAD-IIIA family hydrolase n=1 Tax=Nocardioides sp. Kera G14 TaxID=2884264 RepID=UPI001D0FAD9E|nr:HAD-IIIA family hydrolase [Nocardioides sp. Kera G14]UDY24981.1 HAD-IIIA family hydrolase [Nocardioides sp. Kera G14]